MSISKAFAFLFFSLVYVSSIAGEKDFVKVSENDSAVYYLSQGKLNQRVANAVWVKLISEEKNSIMNYAYDIVLSCSGKWVSEPVRVVGAYSDSLREIYNTSENKSLEVPEFITSFDNSSDLFRLATSNLMKKAKKLCDTAKQKGKSGKLITVSVATNQDTGQKYTYSLMLDGAKIDKSGIINLWFRESYFTEFQLTAEDGRPAFVGGRPLMSKSFDGQEYFKVRRAFDCENDKSAPLSIIQYSPSGNVIRSNNYEDSIKFKSVIPNSITEDLMEWACRLYEN